MGFRFRKSIRLAKGIRLNLSKGGTSLSLGGRGASLNFSKRGTKATVGIPGSGMSWSETTSRRRDVSSADQTPPPAGAEATPRLAWVGLAVFLLVVLLTVLAR